MDAQKWLAAVGKEAQSKKEEVGPPVTRDMIGPKVIPNGRNVSPNLQLDGWFHGLKLLQAFRDKAPLELGPKLMPGTKLQVLTLST
ncbi:hypothetical protein ACHAP8_007876 [Fusarium lateritium]